MGLRNIALITVAAGIGFAIAVGGWLLLNSKSGPVRGKAAERADTQMVKHKTDHSLEPAANLSPRLEQPSSVDSRSTKSNDGHPTSAAPPNTPLASIYDDLVNEANAGDPHAQCRLSAELERCAQLAHDRDDSNLIFKASLAKKGSAAERAVLDELNAKHAALAPIEAICRDISPDQWKDRWRYGFAAAQSEDVNGILAFVIAPPMDQRNFTDDLDGWQVYHDNAGRLLEIAAGKGSPTAAFYLAWAYAGYPVPGGGRIVPRNLTKAAGFALIAKQYADPASSGQIDRMIARWQPELGPVGIAQAQSFATDFATKVPFGMDRTQGDFINSLSPPPEACAAVQAP